MATFPFRALGVVLLSVAVSCATIGPSHRGAPVQTANAQARKTVKIGQVTVDGNGWHCGSATLIRVTEDSRGTHTGTYLTAGHVVNESTETKVLFYPSGRSTKHYANVRLETIRRHPLWDAATFQVTGLPEFLASPVPFAADMPRDGEWILSAGYAECKTLATHTGYIEGLFLLPGYGPCLRSNAQTVVGMSGGPVLNQKGELVGISVAKAGKHIHFFLSVHMLKPWLAEQR